jgi:hypothetical protein
MKTKAFILLLSAALSACWVQIAKAQSWNITGNGNTNVTTNFIGTTNTTGLAFRTNNLERMRITGTGNLNIGLTSGFAAAKLQVANGSSVSLSSPGHFVLGKITAPNLGLDTGVIQARNNGGASTLFLNYFGGPVWIGNHGGHADIYATADGFVGIGTESPSPYRAKVSHASFGFDIENNSSADDWELVTFGSLQLYFNGSFRGQFNSTTGDYSSISDERLKTNIQPMSPVLERVNLLRPASYQFRNGDPKIYNGFVAQEVEQLFPSLVTHTVEPERNLDVYALDYSGFGVIAIKGIQEQQQIIERQQQSIANLEQRLSMLEAALNARK